MSRKKSPQLGIILQTGERIRKIRGNLTQAAFGRIFGVGGNTISRWEAGRLSDFDTLKKIADFGGVTVEWLLRGETPAPQLTEHAPAIYDARPLAPLDFPLLVEVVAAVEEHLNTRRPKRRTIQKARLIAFVYEHCADNKERPGALIIERYLPLAD